MQFTGSDKKTKHGPAMIWMYQRDIKWCVQGDQEKGALKRRLHLKPAGYEWRRLPVPVGWEDELLPWHGQNWRLGIATGRGRAAEHEYILHRVWLKVWGGVPSPTNGLTPALSCRLASCLAAVRGAVSRSGCTSWWPRSRVWRGGRAVTAGASTRCCRARTSPCCRAPGLRCSRCLRWRRSSRPGWRRCKQKVESDGSEETSGAVSPSLSSNLNKAWTKTDRCQPQTTRLKRVLTVHTDALLPPMLTYRIVDRRLSSVTKQLSREIMMQ